MKMFMGVREIYRSAVLEFINEADLKTLFDDGTTMVYLPKEDALNLTFETPEGCEIKSLSVDDTLKVNSIWPHRSPGSEKFIENCIKYNTSIGIYDKSNNELLAWCLEHDYHCLLALQVTEDHKRKGYGSLAVQSITKKISQKHDVDVITNIIHSNVKSLSLFDKIGYKKIDTNSWIGVINK